MTSDEFARFSRAFTDLIEKVESFDVRVPEDSALIGLAADLVPNVTRLLRQGVALLTEVEAVYEAQPAVPIDPAESDDDSLGGIGMLIATEFAARDLTDVAFFARTELRNSLERLVQSATRNTDTEGLALASNCEAGLRCLRKTIVSVESALYEFEEKEPPKRTWFDVEISLQIRKLYWNLRRETEQYRLEGDGRLEERLRNVLYRIVAFRELSVYPFLRVDDRVQLRRLLKRILDWLNGDRRNLVDGRRIWQDLTGFAEILVQVSHRQELQDWDRSLLQQTYNRLSVHRDLATDLATVPPDLLSSLDSVLGLDTALDRLILQASEPASAAVTSARASSTASTEPPAALEEWLTVLKRLLDRMRTHGGLGSVIGSWDLPA